GWIRLVKNDARDPGEAASDAHTPLAAGLAILTSTCADVRREVNMRGNLAWDALQRGDVADARRMLESARALKKETSRMVSSFLLDLGGQVALAEGKPAGGLAIYGSPAGTLGAAGGGGYGGRGAGGGAAGLGKLGKPKEGPAAIAEAETLLETQSRGVP